jgi:hypothetical protein
MQQRCLTGTRLSHQRHEFAGANFETQILKNHYPLTAGMENLGKALSP